MKEKIKRIIERIKFRLWIEFVVLPSLKDAPELGQKKS